jgi:protein-tyrosine phosphatase
VPVDCTWVTKRVATGAALHGPWDAHELAAMGVTHVVDLRQELDDAPFFAGTPVAYLWNPAADDGTPKPDSWWNASLAFCLPALAQAHTKVYAHCSAGVNRGPSTAYAILRAEGFGRLLAERLIRQVRPQVHLAYKDGADAYVARMYE